MSRRSKLYELDMYKPYKKKSDCDVLLNDVENVFGSIGNCVDAALDDRKSKMQVVGGLFGILGATGKLLLRGTGCAIKHTPKALATVASVKRELTDTISDEYANYQKQLKEDALNEKIRQIKHKR